jgi:nucleoid-associated protein EbfC
VKQMKMMRQVQERMARIQKELEFERFEATAGGGAIRAVVDGHQRLLSIVIDPEVASDDVEMLQDLVVAAVNDAMNSSKEGAAARMQDVAAGMGLPPGLV